ncbi:MAG: phosphoribosylformylglycinamidine synthase [Clostridiales bacterium]|nr:phosphoribosylformylglycinamidine synthase [Clostridiales bacterium]
MKTVKRVYVKKKEGFNIHAENLREEANEILGIKCSDVQLINVYDIENLSQSDFEMAVREVLSEPNVDEFFYFFELKENQKAFRVEYLPGQYDQRADSAEQCLKLLNSEISPEIKASQLYVFSDITEYELKELKKYLINPVDSREVGMSVPKSLSSNLIPPLDIKTIDGFVEFGDEDLTDMVEKLGLAMRIEDLKFSQNYFKNENRNPTVTEIKVLDTYWSDHCRHTTFMTQLKAIDLDDNNIDDLNSTFMNYLKTRKKLGRENKNITLMDLATINMRNMKNEGKLDDLELSEEINACSIIAAVDVDKEEEDYLIMFKNETHNHPTEIEPYGGAATCLGGAIRDPLSGRSYVYQSMRISGSGDPRVPVKETILGKLSQRAITIGAATGFSSYGNQIGLNTGFVREYYNPGFIAKRMEVGFVIGASPKKDVTRGIPCKDDLVLLIGGRTGRDGVGGATGSSKIHDEKSIEISGAEVQKGNAPIERKIQRLFRNSEISQMIKRSNDFGAGGVSVAIGEIADSVEVNLDLIPRKYEGLDGTEIAISESQERMAVVIDPSNLETFIKACHDENLEVTVVAKVTDDQRFRLKWRDKTILDLDREFLNSAGAQSSSEIKISSIEMDKYPLKASENLIENLKNINEASQKGLVQRFDNSIGRNNVLSFYGGKHLMTPIQGMVSKVPVVKGETTTVSFVSSGYQPEIANWSPFHGGMFAVVESLSKQIAMGGELDRVRFTFQEYFERLGVDPIRWGKPFSALLGANTVMDYFDLASIGGKDSMSGTYTYEDKRIDVPPSLISFAVSMGKINSVISPEFKGIGNAIVLFEAKKKVNHTFDLNHLKKIYQELEYLNTQGVIKSAYVIEGQGLETAIAKMSFGNEIGAEIKYETENDLYASIVIEMDNGVLPKYGEVIGKTIDCKEIIANGKVYQIKDLINAWESPLEKVFPTEKKITDEIKNYNFYIPSVKSSGKNIIKPKIFIPVFPGTNCEYDTAYKYEKAGGEVDTFVFKNLRKSDIDESIDEMVRRIKSSQILTLAGGFSAGDEPEGSGKFIASVLKNPKIKEALMDFIENRDGLILGVCNGFQALIKLGLLPYGEIRTLNENDPTLTFNKIGRHVAQMVYTKVSSNKSPWMMYADTNKIYTTPVSHGEGRFVADEKMLKLLEKNGQIAMQYVDENGNPSLETRYNPNGSIHAIEAITSPDGRILGKMGHSERIGLQLAINVPDQEDLKIFKAGVDYFK